MNKQLINTLHGKKKYIYAVTLLQVLDMVSLAVIMGICVYLLKDFFFKYQREEVTIYLIILLISIIIKGIMIYLQNLLTNYLFQVFNMNMKNTFYDKLLSLDDKDYENLSSTDFTILYNDGISKLAGFVSRSIPFYYASLINIVLFSIWLSLINYKLGLCMIIGAILIPLGMSLFRRAAKRIVGDKWKSYTNLNEVFLDNLYGLTTLKIYQSDAYKHQEMNELAEDFRKKTMKSLGIRLNSITIMEIVTYLGMACLLILGVFLYRQQEISAWQFLFIALLGSTFFIPARQLGTYAHSYRSAKVLYKKINKILNLPNAQESPITFSEKIQKITLENILYSYNKDHLVLSNLNMEFIGNGLYAIAGKSGCGKSTVLKTILGFLKNEGSVRINDIDIMKINKEFLKKRIVYISSDDFLFKGTVRENLLYAKVTANDEELYSMLSLLQLDFALDMMLESEGSNISLGQKQRLLLGRALLCDADVYLLDEILSGVDVENEKIIISALIQLASTKIIICVTHHLQSIINAKEIYFMDNAMVIESGLHQQLHKKKGKYYEMFMEQAKIIDYEAE